MIQHSSLISHVGFFYLRRAFLASVISLPKRGGEPTGTHGSMRIHCFLLALSFLSSFLLSIVSPSRILPVCLYNIHTYIHRHKPVA